MLYARYVDRRHEHREISLVTADLREAVGARGAEGVDELVRPHKQQLAKWHEALDGFVGSIRSDDRVPQWAAPVIKKEEFELYRTHEFMTNAVMEYYYGGSPPP